MREYFILFALMILLVLYAAGAGLEYLWYKIRGFEVDAWGRLVRRCGKAGFAAVLCLFFLVGSVYAKGFKISKPEKVTAPAGFVEEITNRGLYHKTFKNKADTTKRVAIIGVEPLHYVDSLGVLREFNFDESADTASGYTNAVQVGRFRVEYSPSGKVRYLRKGAMIEFTPAFDTTQVGVEFILSGKGLKSNYILDKTSPNRLAWSFNYSSNFEKVGEKGKGKLKDAGNIDRGGMSEFVAWDANHAPVSLAVTYMDDSLIVVADTHNVVWPIVIDPTVYDSASTTLGFSVRRPTQPTWAGARDSVRGSEYYRNWKAHGNAPYLGPYCVNTTDGGLCRIGLAFDLSSLTGITSVDSAFLTISTGGAFPAGANDTAYFKLVEGTWTGSEDSLSRFSKFRGWKASGAYGSADSSYVTNYFGIRKVAQQWKSGNFNAYGEAAITSVAGTGTLKMMVMAKSDIENTFVFTASVDQSDQTDFATAAPFITIAYTEGNPPGVTTIANMDTLKVNGQAIWFSAVGKVDSTGGTIDSVGVRYMKKGLSLSTNGVVKKAALAGLTATDTFSIALASTDSLTKDTLYVYQMAAHSASGWSYSATYDTLSTYFSAPIIATDNDYDVYATGWVRANVGLTIGTLGANTGTYAAAASQKDSVIIIGVRWGIKGDATPDSTKRTWSSGIKWGTVSDTMTIPATNADTLDLDTLYYVVAFAEGSLDGRRYASFDTTWVNTGGTIPVTLSAPDFTLSSVVLSFSSSLDSTGAVPSKATTRGFFAWKREPNPATPYDGTDTLTVEQSDPAGYPYGTFSLTISGAATDTCYLFRSYATNAAGTAYGDIDSVFTYLRDLEASGVVVVPDVTPIYINGRRVNIVR